MAKSTSKPTDGAKVLFDRLKNDRDNYTQRAEKCATYTIPSLFPKESDDGGTNYATPYQSVGARGVNNLSSKILLAMLPPNQPFFRLGFDQEVQQQLAESGDMTLKAQLDEQLSMMEQIIMRYIESSSMRPTLFEAIKQLVISGNSLLFLPPKEGGMKCYHLRDYIVQRDGVGNVLQIVARDMLARGSLPEELQGMLKDQGEPKPDDKVEVYTHVYPSEDGKNFESYQEIDGEVVAGTEQSYPKTKTPWIPLRFTKKDGEDYGRGFVEDYLGDLISLENLSKAIVDMSMIASKVLYLVHPAAQTNIRQLAKSQNGDFVRGKPEDVQPMQLQKYNDLQVAQNTASNIEARISFAFLLNSAVQRNGERVTAEEIRYVAGELEDTLGGVYSLLSQELQLPLIRRVFTQMQSMSMLPEMEEGLVEPTITTGIEALGRGHDLNKLNQFIGAIVQFGEPAFARIDFSGLISKIAAALGVDTQGLIKTDEQIAQEQQMMQQQQLEMAGGEAAVQQAVTQGGA